MFIKTLPNTHRMMSWLRGELRQCLRCNAQYTDVERSLIFGRRHRLGHWSVHILRRMYLP